VLGVCWVCVGCVLGVCGFLLGVCWVCVGLCFVCVGCVLCVNINT
jgi:hypothetical protein